jgi:hypothetical protein
MEGPLTSERGGDATTHASPAAAFAAAAAAAAPAFAAAAAAAAAASAAAAPVAGPPGAHATVAAEVVRTKRNAWGRGSDADDAVDVTGDARHGYAGDGVRAGGVGTPQPPPRVPPQQQQPRPNRHTTAFAAAMEPMEPTDTTAAAASALGPEATDPPTTSAADRPMSAADRPMPAWAAESAADTERRYREVASQLFVPEAVTGRAPVMQTSRGRVAIKAGPYTALPYQLDQVNLSAASQSRRELCDFQ